MSVFVRQSFATWDVGSISPGNPLEETQMEEKTAAGCIVLVLHHDLIWLHRQSQVDRDL